MLHWLGEGLIEKEIGEKLGISHRRVTALVRAVKDRVGTESRSGLVAASKQYPLFGKSVEEKILVPAVLGFSNQSDGVVPAELSVSDAMPLRRQAPWESDAYRVGPGAFDGPGENLRRLLLMVVVSLSIPALLVLLIVARWAITAATAPTP